MDKGQKIVDIGMFEVAVATIASAVGGAGWGEVRARWLKQEIDKNSDKHEKLKEKVTEGYMTKDDTISMYALMNQTNEVKIDNLTNKVDGVAQDIATLLKMRNN